MSPDLTDALVDVSRADLRRLRAAHPDTDYRKFGPYIMAIGRERMTFLGFVDASDLFTRTGDPI